MKDIQLVFGLYVVLMTKCTIIVIVKCFAQEDDVFPCI